MSPKAVRRALTRSAASAVVMFAAMASPAQSTPGEVIPIQDRVVVGEGAFDAVNPCNGETILLQGTTTQYQHGVFHTDGFFAGGSQYVTTATGTGVETGTEYTLRLRNATANHADFATAGTSSGGIFTARQHLISRGSADNFFLVMTAIMIRDPNGEVRVEYRIEDSGCVG